MKSKREKEGGQGVRRRQRVVVGVSQTWTTCFCSTPTHSFPVTLPQAVFFVGLFVGVVAPVGLDVTFGVGLFGGLFFPSSSISIPTSRHANVCPLTSVKEGLSSVGLTLRSIHLLTGLIAESAKDGITEVDNVDFLGFFFDGVGVLGVSVCCVVCAVAGSGRLLLSIEGRIFLYFGT